MVDFLYSLQSINPITVYCVLFFFAFIENVFPPSPSDLVVVFGGSLIGMGVVGFVPALLITTMGSVVGFVLMYKIGDWFGLHIIEQYKLRFLPIEAIHKVEAWFRQYGYWIIVANRFLSGTRAVVSFFAGMSGLALTRTTILCSVSALVWNACLLYGGYLLGQHWERVGFYLDAYAQTVTVLVVIAAGVIAWRMYRKRRAKGAQ